MNYDRAYVERFIARFVRPIRPELEGSLLGTFDALKSGASLSPQNLAELVDAASDRRANVYGICTEFLGEAAECDEHVLERVRQMTVSRHAHIRHNALLCLTARTPSWVCIDIIRKGLKDKSSLVRRKAADCAYRLDLREVALELSEALKTEPNIETSDVIRGALSAFQS